MRFRFRDIARMNPHLVYYYINFCTDGPYAHQVGHDFLIQGVLGIMGLTGDPSGES